MPKIGDRFNPHRMFDGVFIPEAVCKYKGISPGAKLAYGRFCRFAGRNGEVFPSLSTLGEEIGCGTTQARSYVRELVTDRFVEVEMETGKSNTYYFLWHPSFDGEVGSVRFSPLQDAGGVAKEPAPLQDAEVVPLQDAGGPPLQDAGDEESQLKESQKRESLYSGGEPHNPEDLRKILASRFKRLKGVSGFNGQAKSILADRVQRLDAGLSEAEVLGSFDLWSQLDYWREYDTPGKVRGFFKHLSDNPPETAPSAAPDLRRSSSAAPQEPAAYPAPALPEVPAEVSAWNEIVRSGSPVEMFDWRMPEGEALARCRRHEKFNDSTWRTICEKAEAILNSGNDKTAFLASFQWIIKADQNWWKVLSGGYDHMAARKKSSGVEPDAEIQSLLKRREERRAARGLQP